ncbi:MAG: polyprenyl synthetase family protein [Candidatus Ratteibacteria bacterium]
MLSANAVSEKEIDIEKLTDLSLGVELIHCASLIHDDVIDESLERRGSPSLNLIFGNKTSVIAGDILFIKAIKILNKFPERIFNLIISTIENMCTGVIEEINGFNDYIHIIGKKTASFFSACCECGAIIGGGSEQEIKNLSEYGYLFGILYQINDDLLDKEKLDISFKFIEKIGIEAKDKLNILKNSLYKDALLKIIDFFVNENGKIIACCG